ncbi:MAG: hypothetical protein NZO58_00305 [Gemmataceae bacterium]|nr:hypothetical protein [Gemmataceae bacterium]
MAWHKWFVRGVVFSVAASVLLGVVAYQHWTNPAAVRAQVFAKFSELFPGAAVSIDAASLHLLGNIKVHGLRLVRRNDPTNEVAHFPAAVLFHDKEKMLDGRLSFRKIELHRPRLRLVRDAKGQWNVAGLAAAMPPGQTLPTIVIHHGVIQYEDRRDESAPRKLELTKAEVTLINDPIDVVTIDGLAHSDWLGKVQVHGTWQKSSNELRLAVKATDFRLDGALLEQFAHFVPSWKFHGWKVQGRAGLQANVVYQAAAEPAWGYVVHARVADASVSHPDWPLPLRQLQAQVSFDGSELRVAEAAATMGSARLRGSGSARMPAPADHCTLVLHANDVAVDDLARAPLPEKLRHLISLYQPQGRVSIQAELRRRDGHWVPHSEGAPSRVTVMPQGIAARFKAFPYPLDDVQGTIQCELPTLRVTADLTAQAAQRPVKIKGRWQADGPRVDMLFDIQARKIPVDATLIAALPDQVRTLAESFRVAGHVDVKAQVRRRPHDDKFQGEYHVCLLDGSACWDEFPYALTNVHGFIDVWSPTQWELHGFTAKHGDSIISIRGRSLEPDQRHAKPGVYVELASKNLALDADLRDALKHLPGLYKAWEEFQPSGRAEFTAAIDRRGKQLHELEVRIDVKGPTIRPRCFPFSLHGVAGKLHLQEQRLELRQFSAHHGDARVYLDKGSAELHPSGALYADLPELQAENVRLEAELLAALPAKLREAATALRCSDPLRVKTQLILAHSGQAGASADVYWKGQAWLKNARLTVGLPFTHVTGVVACEGRHNGQQIVGLTGNLLIDHAALYNQPFHDIQGRFQIKENKPQLLLLDLKAPIYGGDVAGQVSLDFTDVPRYELNLTASQIDLQQFGRRNLGSESRVSGVGIARLYLVGVGGDINTLDGHGTLDMPNGKLLNLPFLLDLIKFLGLRWPDRTMFEELHARFAIRGRRAVIDHLELYGNAVSFTGKGEINLDGTDLRLELYPSWARIEQLLPPAVRGVPPMLSKNFFMTVEAHGKISGDSKDIKFTKKPVPVVVDPLLHLRDRWRGGPGLQTPRQPQPSPALIESGDRK